MKISNPWSSNNIQHLKFKKEKYKFCTSLKLSRANGGSDADHVKVMIQDLIV